MAAIIAPLIGGAIGSAIGGGIAGTIVGGIASSVIGAAMSGGLDSLFDNPVQALVGIGMGMIMPSIAPSLGEVWSGFGEAAAGMAAKEGIEGVLGSVLKGIHSVGSGLGNLFIDGPSKMFKGALDSLGEAGIQGMFSFAEGGGDVYLDPGEYFGEGGITEGMVIGSEGLKNSEVLKSMKSFVTNSADKQIPTSSYEVFADQVGPDTDFMPNQQYEMLRNQEIYGDVSKGNSPFTYQEEKASGFLDTAAAMTGDALQNTRGYSPVDKKKLGGGESSAMSQSPMSTPSTPGITTMLGDSKTLSGVGGHMNDSYLQEYAPALYNAIRNQRATWDKMFKLAYNPTNQYKGLMA